MTDRRRDRVRLVAPVTDAPSDSEGSPHLDNSARVDAVYREHGDKLWRSVRAYAGDPDIASDAVAEAFAQLLRRGDEVLDPAAWVWRTAFRIAAGDLKVRRDRPLVELTDVAAPSGAPEGTVLDVLRAVGQLSPLQRAAVLLHDYAGFPSRDAAEVAGSSEAAMRVHLMRGRRRLRYLLEER